MADEIVVNLSGSYSEADFISALSADLETPLDSLSQAEAALTALNEPTVLIWHKFHGAFVGEQDSEAMASWLRGIAHTCSVLRLVFFDEEGEGQ